jgi:hypothetical protein
MEQLENLLKIVEREDLMIKPLRLDEQPLIHNLEALE